MRSGDRNEPQHSVAHHIVKTPARINVAYCLSEEGFYLYGQRYVGRWVSVDPTLNQFPLTQHIRFVTGDLEKQGDNEDNKQFKD